MVNIVKIVIPLLFLLTLGASWPAHGEAVSIMTFNVENLFDNTDDPGKRDETYLPKETKTNQLHIEKCHQVKVRRWREECLFWDWSDDVVRQKLKVVGATIRQVNNGLGPDIVALQEVENMHILEQLRDNHLAGLGYDTVVLIEGNDKRGIDVAFLSKRTESEIPVLFLRRPLSYPTAISLSVSTRIFRHLFIPLRCVKSLTQHSMPSWMVYLRINPFSLREISILPARKMLTGLC